MAAEPSAPRSEDKFGFLVRKIGPLPVWAWGTIAVGIYYWYTHYGPGANKTPATPASGTDTGSDNVTETLNTTTGPTTVNVTKSSGPPTVPRKVKPPNHTPPKKTLPSPRNIRVLNAGSNAGKVGWDAEPGATAYQVRVTYQDKLVNRFTTKNNFANIGGLNPDHSYTTHIAAVNSAGTGPESNGPVLKTTR